MTILATSISIVLTFGTAYLIEHHQKMAARHQMAMLIIHDIDESINQMEKVDSIIMDYSNLQLEMLDGKYSNSIKMASAELLQKKPSEVKFTETTERIFTSNVDTWSTIGKADFIDNVSRCYITRAQFKNEIIDAFHKEQWINESELKIKELDDLLEIDAFFYMLYASNLINRMKIANNLNKQIMGISDKDLEKFTTKMAVLDKTAIDSLEKVTADEYIQNLMLKDAALENYRKNKSTMYPDQGHGSK